MSVNRERVTAIINETNAAVRALALRLHEVQGRLEDALRAEGVDPVSVFARPGLSDEDNASASQEIAALRLPIFVAEYFAVVAGTTPRLLGNVAAAAMRPMQEVFSALNARLGEAALTLEGGLGAALGPDGMRRLSAAAAQPFVDRVREVVEDNSARLVAHAVGEKCGGPDCTMVVS